MERQIHSFLLLPTKLLMNKFFHIWMLSIACNNDDEKKERQTEGRTRTRKTLDDDKLGGW